MATVAVHKKLLTALGYIHDALHFIPTLPCTFHVNFNVETLLYQAKHLI
uniref:Uncharacterized protein n=1 Tax=Anguilla anguilla TaxID=7936 RepID=A0A0E9TPP6_ANGAN